VPISAARLARLKRYDLDWQTALSKVDLTKLSALAKPDLVSLNATVAGNLQQIEADALTLAQVAPLVPFAPKLVGLIEARIRVDQVEPQKAAGTLVSVINELKTLRANLDADAADFTKVRAVALPAAQAATQLRSGIAEWFNFYNGYDPLFTWWMGMPFKQLDAALQDYSTFLRDKAAKTDADTPMAPATIPPVTPSAPSKYASVPDLAEILALGQDEMRDIVGRFNGGRPGGGGRGGRGAQPAAADAPSPAAPSPCAPSSAMGVMVNAGGAPLFTRQ